MKLWSGQQAAEILHCLNIIDLLAGVTIRQGSAAYWMEQQKVHHSFKWRQISTVCQDASTQLFCHCNADCLAGTTTMLSMQVCIVFYCGLWKYQGWTAHSYYGLFYVVSNCERACSQHLGQVVGKDRIQRMEG